jgi:hypothetical protein
LLGNAGVDYADGDDGLDECDAEDVVECET